MNKLEESDSRNALPASDTRKYPPLKEELDQKNAYEQDSLYFYAVQRAEHPYISEDEFSRHFQLDGQLWGGLALVLVIVFVPLIYFVFSF